MCMCVAFMLEIINFHIENMKFTFVAHQNHFTFTYEKHFIVYHRSKMGKVCKAKEETLNFDFRNVFFISKHIFFITPTTK